MVSPKTFRAPVLLRDLQADMGSPQNTSLLGFPDLVHLQRLRSETSMYLIHMR